MLRPGYNFLRYDYWFGEADSRPMALFRIAFAGLLLKDALYHLVLAEWFYSDTGVLPRYALFDGLAPAPRFSLMDAAGEAWMAGLVFLAWAGVALCLLVGYRTRLMSILNFVVVLSIHERNVYLLTGADTLMRVLSFWMMFLPLGQHYAVDALRGQRYQQIGWGAAETPKTAYAFPLRMIQLQVALVYLAAGVLKAIGPVWQNGDALHYVLQLHTILLPPGDWLQNFAPDWLLRVLTWQVTGFELLFSLLMFLPLGQPSLRFIGLLLGLGLHVGIGLTLAIPDFSLFVLCSYLLFFEGEWAEAVARWGRRIIPIPRLLLQFTSPPGPLSTSGEGEANPRPQPFDLGARGGNPHSPNRAGLETNTYNAKRGREKAVLTVGLALMMLGVVWWNRNVVADYAGEAGLPMPRLLGDMVEYAGLWQYWDLYAPLPFQVDGWIEIPGRFEDGTTAALYSTAPQTDGAPTLLFGPLMRWKKYEENVSGRRNDAMLRSWGRYYCRLYNDAEARLPGKRLATLEIHFVYRRAYPPGGSPNPLQDDLLWKHWCYDEYAY